jgi:SPP1 gp7 family putative phage head morphogenesis protein
MTASERIRDLAIRHGLYLERYTKQESLELIKTLETAYNDILSRIEKTDGAWTRKRLNEILIETRQILREATGKVEAKLFDDLQLLAEYEAERAYKDFAGSIPVRLETTAPAPEQLWAAIRLNPATQGATLSELTKKWEANSVDRFIHAIRLGVSEGDTVDDLVRRVRGRVIKRATKTNPGVYEGGAINATTKGAQALVRTAVAHVNNQAREAVYQSNEDIIKGYQWVATLDAATCPVCGSYDGQVWEDDTRPEPPAHPQCRCVIVPVLKSFRELGLDIDEIPDSTRASMDGQVPEKLSYSAWLKGQSKEFQEDVLGIKRAELFRSGKPLDSMVDNGRLVTLEGLRVLES